MSRYVLVDGNSLAYRAFFAMPETLVTSSGEQTNAFVGFLQMLTRLLEEQRPAGMAVAFDLPGPTFRHDQDAEYKAQRAAMPEALVHQLGLIRRLLEVLGIAMLSAEGFEADDVLATVASALSSEGQEVVVVTGDRDAFQLAAMPGVRILYTRRGVSDTILLDSAGVEAQAGVPAERYPDLAALRGDPSDNLPGVPGVGAKTAARLVSRYGSLEEVLAHADELTPKLAAAVVQNAERARLNLAMTMLRSDVPVSVEPGSLAIGPVDAQGLSDLLNLLEVGADRRRRLLGALKSAEVAGAEVVASEEDPSTTGFELPDLSVPEGVEPALQWLQGLLSRAPTGEADTTGERVAIVVVFDGLPGRSDVVGLALGDGGAGLWLPANLLGEPTLRSALGEVFSGSAGGLDCHRAKEAGRALAAFGLDFRALRLDPAVAAWLVEPGSGSYDLGELASRWLRGEAPAEHDHRSEGQLDLAQSSPSPVAEAARMLGATTALAPRLEAELASQGELELYQRIERPLSRVLARMEVLGIAVDTERLERLAAEMAAESAALEDEICDIAGERFNVNSTPQLRRVLYEKLGLAPSRKTKTGWSTDARTLEGLRASDPTGIVERLLRYREVEKLRSTYGASLLAEVAEDGRIHASFNQTVARTGRISSEHPNLHNIPVRSEEGRRFREVFVAAPGCVLLVADYDQVELRIIAHLSGDPGLAAAFAEGRDVHREIASQVFGVAPEAVSHELRSRAKMVSYGLAYGMEAFGLAQRLGCPVDEAQAILDAYFRAFPGVKAYMDRAVAEARRLGYTETLLGRRRPLPELSARERSVRQAAERQAMNAGIQGLAADLFKVALVDLDRRLEEEGLRSRLVLQVHDEVVVEVPTEEVEEVNEVTVTTMKGAFDLHPPLEVAVGTGRTWAEAKE